MSKDKFSVTGRVRIEMVRENGGIEDEEFGNLVVTVGKAHIASRISGVAMPTAIGWIAVGTGTNAPAAGDTALQTELYREACAVNPSANTVQYQTTLSAGEATGALTEAGLFNAAAAGDMPCRVTFPVKNKAAGDAMTITWTLTVN